ncbi:MAG TPA: PfkB family carbohydrate kinase [Spirochaetales bacterium]|nr:carbohydrate kinase [Spirochaetales bacterium]HOV39658.1 PfkB family carbohydrate kinase [Spirochaetales bacterium]
MKTYDIVMIGHVSKDIMIYGGKEEKLLGGAVVYSSAAAARSGAKVLVITKAAHRDLPLLEVMRHPNVELVVLPTEQTTSIQNEYFSEDRERRKVTLLAQADPFRLDELPPFQTPILQLAGLFYGEIPVSLIPPLADRYTLAVDAQGLLRRNTGGSLAFQDLENKEEILPHITYLKTDAAEAEVLTGSSDREKAARLLAGFGPKEVMVTHNTEVLLLRQGTFYRAPFTPRNLSGRTGRGDTCFASYLYWRLSHSPAEAVAYAAALTSIKMETPGVFTSTVEDVLLRMKEDSLK